MEEEEKDEVIEPEYELDLENLPKQDHNWVRRGLKVNCEGAAHPFHSHFLTKRSS